MKQNLTREWQLITLSASDEISLSKHSENLLNYFEKNEDASLSDIAYTLNLTQKNDAYRKFIVCRNANEAIQQLGLKKNKNIFAGQHAPTPIFLFPGQGNQYFSVGSKLYQSEKVFKETFGLCAKIIESKLGFDITDKLFPDLKTSLKETDWTKNVLYSQPALFSISFAIAKLWEFWGLKPKGMIGHSIGEMVSAAFAEVISVEEALSYICETAVIASTVTDGDMVLVNAGIKEFISFLNKNISIASENAEDTFILSGKKNELEKICAIFDKKNLFYKKLNVGFPFHSKNAKILYSSLERMVENFKINPPKIPYTSCITGEMITDKELYNASYWANLFIAPMLIKNTFQTIHRQYKNPLWIETGPGNSMTRMLKKKSFLTQSSVLTLLNKGQATNELENQAISLGKAWLMGVNVDWATYYFNEVRCVTPLPKSPFGEISFSFKKNRNPEKSSKKSKPKNKKEHVLYNIFMDILGVKNFCINENFFELGGDSILALQCIARARHSGFKINLDFFLKNPTVSFLANSEQLILSQAKEFSVGPVPLLPLQKRFFSKEKHWSEVKLIPAFCTLKGGVSFDRLEKACQKLFTCHDALRLRFFYRNGCWEQILVEEETLSFDVVDFSMESSNDRSSLYAAYIENKISRFDLGNGPLIRFSIIILEKDKPFYFMVAFHHLCLDGVSLQILLQDIDYFYNTQGNNTKKISIRQSASFKKWADFVEKYAHENLTEKELFFWLSFKKKNNKNLPIDFPFKGQKNLAMDIREIKILIDQKVTKNIHKIIPQKRKPISTIDILITAFVLVMNEFSEQPFQWIDLRRHGRDPMFNEIDLSRTVGWLTLVHPILIELAPNLNLVESVNIVHQQLAISPKDALSYSLLRYSVQDKKIKEAIETLPKAQLAFNYHGSIDSALPKDGLFKLEKSPVANNLGSQATRSHLINLDISIKNQSLSVLWTFSKSFHKEETIVKLAKDYAAVIEKIVDSFK